MFRSRRKHNHCLVKLARSGERCFHFVHPASNVRCQFVRDLRLSRPVASKPRPTKPSSGSGVAVSGRRSSLLGALALAVIGALAVAAGVGSAATGVLAVAAGVGSTTAGELAVVAGEGSATAGVLGVAAGVGSAATGVLAVAVGVGSTTAGVLAVAVGAGSAT